MKKDPKKAERADTLKRYQAFERRRKLCTALMLLTTIILFIYLLYPLFFTDDGTQQLFASLWFFIFIFGIVLTASTIAKRGKKLPGY